MLESLKLLISADSTAATHLLHGLEIDTGRAEAKVLSSPSVTTALLPFIGYKKAAEMAAYMKEYGLSIAAANKKLGYINEEKLKEILKPGNLVQGGYSLKDLEE
jgi:fumarate hydratase class II